MIPRFLLPFLICASSFLAGCNNGNSTAQAPEPLPHSHRFPLRIGEKEAQVQFALTRDEMARGLMRRTHLEADEGMMFVYPRPMQASFWMKNTPLPLDIGFFNREGRLLEIYRLHPNDEVAVKSRSNDVQFALEMNRGWFSRNNLRPGASVDIEMLGEALKGRGVDPASYGLQVDGE